MRTSSVPARSWLVSGLILAVALALLAGLPAPARAQAGTIHVTTTQDRHEPEGCETTGDCSLREAVILTNDNADLDTIFLPAGVHTLTRIGMNDDSGVDGDLDVYGDLTIIGAGSGQSVIDASGLRSGGTGPGDRVLHAHGSITLTLQGLTVRGGHLGEGTYDETDWNCGGIIFLAEGSAWRDCNGGGIFLQQYNNGLTSEEPVTLVTDDVVIRDNVSGSSGGGIGGTGSHVVLDLTGTVITGNEARGSGGGIPVAETRCCGGGGGGGVWVSGELAELDFDAVLIGGDEDVTDSEDLPEGANSAVGDGGGMLVDVGDLDADLRQTSIDGNYAARSGGGLSLGSPRLIRLASEDETARTLAMDGGSIDGNLAGWGAGGASLSDMDAQFTNASISRNEDRDDAGGIYANGVDLHLESSTLAANTSHWGAGALWLRGGSIGPTPRGDVAIVDTTVHGNAGGWPAGGVGIEGRSGYDDFASTSAESRAAAYGDGYEVTISGSTFSNNTSKYPDSAGGLFVHGAYRGSVENSTVSGNESPGAGAGVLVPWLEGDLSFTNVTFSGNTATEFDFGIESESTRARPSPRIIDEIDGGTALHVGDPYDDYFGPLAEDDGEDWEVTLTNTIVANSNEANCNDTEHLVSLGHTIDDDGTCVGEPSGGDQVTDPQLGPLASNGGPTRTHALVGTSPAIDAIPPDTACPTVDQRGVLRPQDGNDDGTARCDIGAYERLGVQDPDPGPDGSADLAVAKSVAPDTVRVGQHLTYTVEVTNAGPDAVTGVVLTDDLPASVTALDLSTSAGTCAHAAGVATCELGAIPAGGAETVTIVVRTNASGEVTNTASVAGDQDDPDPANNVATATATVEAAVTRLYGRDRIETAIAVSNDQFDAGAAGAVVLARSDLYPDALAGTPLAIDRNGPMLLTAPIALDPRTEAEIQRVLSPGGTVYLLGGLAALSQPVEDRIRELGYTVVRYAGPDRFATAVAIADEGLGNRGTHLLATGIDFPDALSAGAAAGVAQGAVLLTVGDEPHPVTQAYLAEHAGTRYAIGGPAVRAHPEATPLRGATRIETALAVANEFTPNPPTVGVATAYQFADALTGGAHVGRMNGPILLTAPTTLPAELAQFLEDNRATISSAFFYGGPVAMSEEVEAAIRQLIQ